MIETKTDAQLIAESIYPEDWFENPSIKGFKADNNAGKRAVAVEVAQHFIDVLQSETTANAVMRAFYRREHHKEPNDEESKYLRCHMSTALLAYQIRLKDHG
tara:strand:- start:26391 stop:26696 length:306 start_codon:yes stop_codon:yes gene_type:complete